MLGGMNRRTAAVLALIACHSIVSAQDKAGEPREEDAGASERDLGVDSSLTFAGPAGPFGAEGQQHWSISGGLGFPLESDDDSVDTNLTLAYHRFLIDDLEFLGEIGGWYFAQDGDDAGGINPGFTLRYHLINRDRWTLFADAGIGLLFATGDVPVGGTSFNFTPHVGAGATFRLGDSASRLVIGARWHHVSNARIEGDGRNPDRDGVFVYGGVMWPF